MSWKSREVTGWSQRWVVRRCAVLARPGILGVNKIGKGTNVVNNFLSWVSQMLLRTSDIAAYARCGGDWWSPWDVDVLSPSPWNSYRVWEQLRGASVILGQGGLPQTCSLSWEGFQSGQRDLNSAHPQHLEQKITVWWLPGTEARSWKENMGNGCKGRHKVAGQENNQTAKRASQGEVNKIDSKYIWMKKKINKPKLYLMSILL